GHRLEAGRPLLPLCGGGWCALWDRARHVDDGVERAVDLGIEEWQMGERLGRMTVDRPEEWVPRPELGAGPGAGRSPLHEYRFAELEAERTEHDEDRLVLANAQAIAHDPARHLGEIHVQDLAAPPVEKGRIH